MTQAPPIHKVVLGNWPVFKGMGWTSPSRTIKYYKEHPTEFQEDLTELIAASAMTRRTEPAEDVKEQTRLASAAVHNIRTLAGRGYSAEAIQEMVPCYVGEGEMWALNSIRKIAQKEMGMIAAWAKDFGKGL